MIKSANKIEITGILKKISPVKANAYSKMVKIVIHQPAVIEPTRGINYKQDDFPVHVYNEKIEKIKPEWIDQIVRVVVFVNGIEYMSPYSGEITENIRFNLDTIELCQE